MVLRVSEAAGREMGVTRATLIEAIAQVRASDAAAATAARAAAATAARAAAMDRMRASRQRQRQRAMQETTSQQQTLASARAVGIPAAAAAAAVDSATRGFYKAFQTELLAQTQAPAAAPAAVQLEDGAAVQAQQPAGGGWDNPVEVDDDEEDHLATHI
ncbi:hypothetical protein AALP_AA7G005800 [Arabis alpina]|uniref:Uncharacterized protein n=1 Tax=Arabis alpina TaxID=50452 RepID=A0A087GF58_ARAAL|nr:hypothetical protein AALP_AA7G005800 [Arabis alpina]